MVRRISAEDEDSDAQYVAVSCPSVAISATYCDSFLNTPLSNILINYSGINRHLVSTNTPITAAEEQGVSFHILFPSSLCLNAMYLSSFLLVLVLVSSLLLLVPQPCFSLRSPPAFINSSTVLQADQVMKTVIQWSRQLRTCDAAADTDIAASGTSRIVYAQGSSDPASDSRVMMHSTMGVRNVNLLDLPMQRNLPSDARNLSIMSRPFPIGRDTETEPGTYYHCQGFAESIPKRSHLVLLTPQIDYAHAAVVHHMLLFFCEQPLSAADLAWAGNCYSRDTPRNVSTCDQEHVVAGWAVGGGEFVFPPEAGLPIGGGGGDGMVYFMMQIHYHNPASVSFNDSAGFRLTLTEQLRQHDAGTIVLHQRLQNIVIPPRQPSYNVSLYCPADCTSQLPSTGISVFGSMLHTHEAGRQVRTDQYRNGRQLQPVDSNLHYDFNFQQIVTFPPHRYPQLLPGDSLKLTCTYETMERTGFTHGGISTKSEMCMDYLWYYPASYSSDPWSQCYGLTTQPVNDTFSTICNVDGDWSAFVNFTAPPVTALPVVPACTPAALGNRTWGSAAALNGSTGAVAITAAQWLQDRASYSRSMVLDEKGQFVLYWNASLQPDGVDGVVHFAAEVETSGWLGIGLSASGAMINSDSVIGWVVTQEEGADSLTVDMTDRYNRDYAQPPVDVSQDIFNVRGLQTPLPVTVPPPNPIYYNVTGQQHCGHHSGPGCDDGASSGSASPFILGSSSSSSAASTPSQPSGSPAASSVSGLLIALVVAVVVLSVCVVALLAYVMRLRGYWPGNGSQRDDLAMSSYSTGLLTA